MLDPPEQVKIAEQNPLSGFIREEAWEIFEPQLTDTSDYGLDRHINTNTGTDPAIPPQLNYTAIKFKPQAPDSDGVEFTMTRDESKSRYIVEHTPFAHGSFSHIYRGWDRRLNKIVAIKELISIYGCDDIIRNTLELEAKTMARIEDEGTVRVLNYMVAKTPSSKGSALPVIVMDYVEGPTLKERLNYVNPLSANEIVDITSQLAGTIDGMASKYGLFHRDVKPANIFLAGNRVLITDFGLSTWACPNDEDMIVGSPKYISPEAVKGIPVTLPSEVFSLGSNVYHMITGQTPFSSHDQDDNNYTICQNTAARPHFPVSNINNAVERYGKSVALSLDLLFQKVFDKDPSKRFQTAAAFSQELKKILT